MKRSSPRSGLKFVITFFLGLTVFVFATNAGWLQIPSAIDNVVQVIQRILVTDDGTQTGNPIMDINTGGSVLVYGPLLDAGANPYLTGFVEVDPLWLVEKANYYTKTQIDAQSFLTSEVDPFWSAEKDNYYSKLAIDAKGYLTGFTELDSVFLGSDAAGITSTQIGHWTTAYGRGNHATVGYLTGEVDPDWNSVKTNYYTKIQIDASLAGLAGGLTYRGSRDYSACVLPSDVSKGDLYVLTNPAEPSDPDCLHMESPDQIIANKDVVGSTSTGDWDVIENDYTEQDPLYSASPAFSVTNGLLSDWSEAHGRGNHATFGYLTAESDPVWSGDKANYYTKSAIDAKGYLTTYTETDPVFSASAAKNITNTNVTNWNSSYSRGDHRLVGYITGGAFSNYYTKSAIDAFGFLTGVDMANYYSKSAIDSFGYITGYTETDPKIGTLVAGKGCYATGGKIVCNQDFAYDEVDPVFSASASSTITSGSINHWNTAYARGNHSAAGYLTGESDPLFVANSGNYYLASNPAGYITAASNVWSMSGSDIVNNNTGNIFINNYLHIGENNNIYPLYVWADNTDDIYSNYIAIDGPDSVEKGYQIGGGGTSEEYKWAMYTAPNDHGDKLNFANGNSKRDVLTLAAGGRVGFNLPTDLLITTPSDGFSIYPQYFDSVMRYDGSSYYDHTLESHSSVGDAFIFLSSHDDTLLIGKEYPWRATYIGLDTPAGSPGTLVVKYSKDGGSWDEVVGLSDTTNRFTRNGNISWNFDPFLSTWEKRTIDGKNLYWIQMSLSSLGGNTPTARIITNLGVNRFALYAAASDVNPMLAMDSEARFGILPPELTGKYQMGKLPGLTSSQMEIVSNTTLKNNIISYLANDESGAGYNFVVAKSHGTVDNKLPVISTDVLGGLFGFGYDGGTFRQASSIVFGVDGTPDIMDMPGKISFFTTPDSQDTPLERMTIKNNGRVGIGTTNPSQMLTVEGNINVTSGYHVYDGNGTPYVTVGALGVYLTGESDPVFVGSPAFGISSLLVSHWNTAYGRGDHATMGYLTGETDPVWNSQKINYYTKTQIDNKAYLTGESDPVWMATSGNYYLASNPNNYISANSVPWTIGADITNNNTGEVHINTNLFVSGHINIGANTNTTYPLYVWATNTGVHYPNYITIDGPNTINKGFQIGGVTSKHDFERSMHTHANEDGDKLYFQNGNTSREVLTIAGGGAAIFNFPTALGQSTPADAFSLYPQYFDYVARYDGSSYHDVTIDAYTSNTDPFVIVSDDTDVFLLGKEYPRRSMYLDIATPAGTPGMLQVKYSKAGGTWNDVVELSDTTDKLKQDGTIGWALSSFKSTWEKRTINGKTLYWIQMSLSSLGGNAPTARLINNMGVNRFALYAGAGDVNPMFAIDSSARVGIISPELTGKYELGRLPGLLSTQLEIVSNESSKSDVVSYLANNVPGAGAAFISAKSKGTIDNKLAVTNGDVLGGLFGFGYDGATFRSAANIVFSVDGTPNVMDMPGKISFFTTPDGDETAVERMTIKNNGRIGIGTNSPTQALSVEGNVNVTSGYDVYDGNGHAYVTMEDLSGHLLDESDPVWTIDKPNYSTTAQINAKGYLTGYTETDPIFGGSPAFGISTTGIASWNTAYARGNHASQGYLTGESDPVWNSQKVQYYTKIQVDDMVGSMAGGLVYKGSRDYSGCVLPSDISKGDLYVLINPEAPSAPECLHIESPDQMVANKDVVGPTSTGDRDIIENDYAEQDPIYSASPAFSVTNGLISDWSEAHARGNHAIQGYLKTETDPVRTAEKTNYYTKSAIDAKGYLTTYSETDPVFLASAAYAITNTNKTNWNAAYARGNHASMGYITGYTETDPIFGASVAKNITNTNVTNWNTAYARGNHASMGYITSYTETDPVRTAASTNYYTKTQADAKGYITSSALAPYVLLSQTGNWNTAYGRGNHASAGYAFASSLSSYVLLSQTGNWNIAYSWMLANSGNALSFTSNSGNYYTKTQVDAKGYLTTETDPIFAASAAYGITNTNKTNWNTAYARGNHASMGYITGYTETDPIFGASVAKNITNTNVTNWNTAYSRGNHASMGYITSYTETDPVRTAASTNYYTKIQTDAKGYITSSALAPYVLLSQTGNWNTAYSRGNHASAGYITSSALAPYVLLSQTGNWNTAYSRGNHASAGYVTGGSLTNYYTKTEIDNKGYLTGVGYTLQVQALSSNPVDNQTVYFGYLPAAPSATAYRKVQITRSGTIRSASITSYSTTAGTNTAWPMYIRVNNTADTLIASLSLATNDRVWTNANLNIPVVAGDFIEIKLINPTWTTNPSGTVFGGYLYIE